MSELLNEFGYDEQFSEYAGRTIVPFNGKELVTAPVTAILTEVSGFGGEPVVVLQEPEKTPFQILGELLVESVITGGLGTAAGSGHEIFSTAQEATMDAMSMTARHGARLGEGRRLDPDGNEMGADLRMATEFTAGKLL